MEKKVTINSNVVLIEMIWNCYRHNGNVIGEDDVKYNIYAPIYDENDEIIDVEPIEVFDEFYKNMAERGCCCIENITFASEVRINLTKYLGVGELRNKELLMVTFNENVCLKFKDRKLTICCP